MVATRPIACLLCTIVISAAQARDTAAPAPDLSGAWARLTFGFERPASGPGPIGRYNNQANVGGDFNNPILQPQAAAVVKKRSEILRSGVDYPNPSLNCWPMVSPYIFRVQEMQVLQKKDEVVFLFMQDHQVRRIRLNSTHPANITPSWQGDSIGHYEGDALVVDTVGVKLGPEPLLDMYGSPYSDVLHVIERYRLVEYEVARGAQDKNIRDAGPVATEQAAVIDEDYRGKGLQIAFTVDDSKTFKTPWSAIVTWRRAGGWVENVCAENTHEYYNGGQTSIPQAAKPDF
jgi:hypothetical protein